MCLNFNNCFLCHISILSTSKFLKYFISSKLSISSLYNYCSIDHICPSSSMCPTFCLLCKNLILLHLVNFYHRHLFIIVVKTVMVFSYFYSSSITSISTLYFNRSIYNICCLGKSKPSTIETVVLFICRIVTLLWGQFFLGYSWLM